MGCDLMTKKILFRADAKLSIGTGDLMSLISLSRHFIKAGWKPYFMIRGYEAALKIAEKFSISNLTVLAPDCSLEDEIKTINALCEREKISVVFFEITERELSEYKGLSNAFKKAAVSFDGSLLDDLSLVVSWMPDAQRLFHPEKYPNTRFLLGYEYVTLPPEFYDDIRIKNRAYRNRPERLLVAMGGADENNLTKKVIDTLIRYDIDIFVTVIVGGGYEYLNDLEYILCTSGLRYEVKHNIINMLDEYLNCDIAIGAGGLTASELVASRTTAMLIASYEHQIERCIFFQKQGWVKYLGYMSFAEKTLLYYIYNPPVPLKGNSFKTYKIMQAINEFTK